MKINKLLYLILALPALFAACSKTVYDQETRPYTDIISFYIEGQVAGKQQLQGVISNDSIVVYWNPEVAQPSNIVPTIQVAAGASISPASGTSVAFSNDTKYTVTAENGDTKEYTLRIKTNRELPILTAVVASFDNIFPIEEYYWRITPNSQATSGVFFNMLGEYFLATGNKEDIKVYMQRLHDGYEVDLAIDQESISNTSLKVELPKFSNQLDTGRHRIWVQVGDLVSESKDIFMRTPSLQQVTTVEGQLKERGTPVHAGQNVTINYKYVDQLEGAITRYYDAHNLHSILLSARRLERIDTTINPRTGRPQYTNVFKDETFHISEFEATNTEIKFKLPAGFDGFVGGYIRLGQLLYNFINAEGIWTHLSSGGATQYGQAILFDNSFQYAPDPVTGRLSIQTTIVSANAQ